MSITSKLSVCVLAAVCAGMLSAEDLFVQSEPADFAPVKRIIKGEDAFSVKGAGVILSAKSFTLDPAKKYQISGEFCQKGGKQTNLYLGFAPYDAKGRQIFSNMVNIVKDTQTEVAVDAKKGDTVVKVNESLLKGYMSALRRIADECCRSVYFASEQANRIGGQVEEEYGVKPIIYTTQSFYFKYFFGENPDYPLWIRNVYWLPFHT